MKIAHTVAVTVFLLITFTALLPFGGAIGWSSETQLTTHDEWDLMPSIMQTHDGIIWVVWASARSPPNGYQYDLYYDTSSDYGSSWSGPTRLTTSFSHDQWPSVMQARDGAIWVVWESEITGSKEIFYKISSDGGARWSPIIQLTNNSDLDAAPCVTQNIDETIWVVWHSNRTGNHDIFGIHSSDYGLTWSDAKNLTTHTSWDMQPSITWTEDGTLWLAWASYRDNDDYEIFYRTSSNNGQSWSAPTQLTTNVAEDTRPSVIQDVSGTMWVVWEKDEDIYYITSSNYGGSWTADTKLYSSSGDDKYPSVVNTDVRTIWVVWSSSKTGNYEIFYKISDEITPVHDIAITKITPWVEPDRIITSAPKGTTVYVNVTVENQGTFDETFNVTTYAERITRDVYIDLGTQYFVFLTNRTTTTLTFVWDTADTPSGSYFISSNATIVQGEYDTLDNVLLDGAYIGGIFTPGRLPEVNLLARLSPLALTILVVAALGVGAVFFFKLLMSVKPRWPWRLSYKAPRQNAISRTSSAHRNQSKHPVSIILKGRRHFNLNK